MKLTALVTILVLGLVAGASWTGSDEPYIAEAPDQIRPLMIGAKVPDVTLVTPDLRPVALREALAEQPTILIYYRGGW